MFKSKKRLLLVLASVLAVAGTTTGVVGVTGGWFGGGPKEQAQSEATTSTGQSAGTPVVSQPKTVRPSEALAPNEFASPGARMAWNSNAATTGSYSPASPPNAPAVYSSTNNAPIVRGNDDGSFQPAAPPARMSFGDAGGSPTPAEPEKSYTGYTGESTQRFLASPSTPINAAEIEPPGALAAPANTAQGSSTEPPPPRIFPGYSADSAASSAAGGAEVAPFSAPAAGPPLTAPSAADAGPPSAQFDNGYGRSSRDAYVADRASSSSRGAIGAAAYLSETDGGAIGEPGAKNLEGVQSPSLTIEKVAPGEIQVGKQASFVIKVRNVGQVDAQDVVVFDQTPRGTRYAGSTPEAAQAPDGSLMWRVGALKPGEESTITLNLVPMQEGQIGSVARVAFAAQASASTICTKPLLTVEHTGPSSVLIGEGVPLTIIISNPGTGIATGVTLEEDVPDGLSHPAGNELEYEIGSLRPGESRKIELSLTAAKPGLISNLLLVRGDGNLVAEDRLELEVVAPQLQLALTGPSKRYLERQATYNVRIANPGTAAAKNIELVTYLPKGLKFVSTDNQGQYDAQNHAVYWSLEELPPRMTGDVTVTAMPIETGQQKLRVEGRGDLGLTAAFDQEVLVEGLAELFFQVVDSADPIEVDSETEYEIRVVNQGSKTDTNVRVIVQMPIDLEPIGGDGPTRVRVDGQNVIFEPLARLAPKGSAVYKVRVRGAGAGDHRVRVQVVSDEVRTPVSKEESTRVYADQ